MSKTTYTKEKRDPQIQWYETSNGKRWRVKFSISKFGKRRYCEQSGFTSYNEAKAGKIKLLNQLENKLNLKGGKQTVSDYWDTYNQLKLQNEEWRPTTHRNVTNLFKLYILPYWASAPLEDIRRLDVQQWMTELSQKHDLSHYYLKHVYRVFSDMLGDAVINDLIIKNPAQKITVTGKSARDQSMTRHEYDIVVDFILHSPKLNDTDRAIAILTLHGLRRGEILGLKLKYVRNDSIEIQGQVNRFGVYTEPKTSNSIRTVPLMLEAYTYLNKQIEVDRKLLAKHNRIMTPDDFIFLNKQLRPYSGTKFDHLFEKISAETGVKVWAHKMRHAFSTFAFNIPGTNPKDIMRILGHANIEMSMAYNMGTDEGTKQIMDNLSKEVFG
ncbi:tyrosine-type recombinase/integrase [Weissella viridescens]|uniref:tyrosine-type recombinase/integrase n=1 Tax=Weissella viridescens TaxID=1629 RepID=UPI003AF2BFD3